MDACGGIDERDDAEDYVKREAIDIRDNNDGRNGSEDFIRIDNTAVERSMDDRATIEDDMSYDGTDFRGGSDGRDGVEGRMGRNDTDSPITRVATERSCGNLPRELAEEPFEREILIYSLDVPGVAFSCLNGNSARTRFRRRCY